MKSNKIATTLAAALALSLPSWAQQSQLQQQSGGAAAPVQPISTQSNTGNSQAPVPAARGLFVGYEPEDNNGTAQVQPDDHLLSGVESFGLGVLHSVTTLFDPSFFVTESASNEIAPGQWDTATSLGGGLALVRDWNHSRIAGQYFGAQSFYRPGSQSDGAYHALSLSEAIHAGRWNLLFRNDLLYTQAANFSGFQTGGIAPATGAGSGSALQQSLAPSETINTGQVGTLNETASGQLAYSISRRTAISVAAVYGLMHFTGGGYIDSHTLSGILGYNYALSRLNSIAGIYSYSQDDFNGSNISASSHTLQGAFGRKITGKLAFQAAAGPQIVELRNSFGTQGSTTVSWAANGSLTYGPRPRRVSYTAAYAHGLTSGSGVFAGAESDTATASVQASFGRSWFGSINAGYASNLSLADAGAGATRYNNWFGETNLNRSLGRQFLFSITYEYEHQAGNGVCPVLSCGISPTRQSASARLQWHPWPAKMQ